MPDVATIRTREDAVDVRWVFFIEGIPQAFTTDNGQGRGTLLGSGGSTWMGLSETSIGGVEVSGARTVLGGLEMPRTLGESIDPKSGEPIPRPATFKIHDDENGTIAALFGREGKEYDILRHRIAGGTDAVAATGLGQAGDSIGLRGRWIGLERTGSSGERRLFPATPDTWVGLEHSVHQDELGILPPIKVSDEPIQWVGRIVTVYAIYRDPDDPTEDATAWPTWDDQADNRAWVGVIQGVRRVKAGVWDIRCHGRDGLIRKQLGRVTSGAWRPLTTELGYESNEDGISIFFERRDAVDIPTLFNSLSFGTETLTGTTKSELIDEIHALIQDVYDGTTTPYAGTEGDLDAWSEAATDQDAEVGLLSGTPSSFYCRKTTMSADQTLLVMHVAMHSKVWRQLGFEPETQNYDIANLATENDQQIGFTALERNTEHKVSILTGANVPDADGYWMGRFTTVAVGFTEVLTDGNEWDNDGARRRWLALYPSEPFTLNMTASDQVVRLGDGESPYAEGQLTVEVSGNDVDGAAGEYSRYFAIRGKVLRGVDEEPEETIQVAQLEWVEGNYGTIDPGTGALPALILRRWMDPRPFGFPYERLEGLDYWTGIAGSEAQIDAAPLHAYAYLAGDKPEYAHHVWGQVMLSTGSGGGVSGGAVTVGDNSPGYAGSLRWADDVELADMGCGIPYQLVDTLTAVRAVFDQVPGGALGPLNRVRHAYIGPYLAQEVLRSLMRPRRLMWSYHGDVLGVVQLAPFSPGDADVLIGEADLYGDRDARSHIPDQQPAPVGQLDGVDFTYRWYPSENKTQESFLLLSRDAEATARTGELVEKIEDRGLLAADVLRDIDGPQWIQEFEQLWAEDAAEFFAQDHYSITLTVSRPKGQDIRPGTRVLMTNPWPANNAGSYGLTDHAGIVVGRELDTRTHATRAEVFVFAGQGEGWRFHSPMARIIEQSGVTLTISTDQYSHGGSVQDGDGYSAPSWTSATDSAAVQIVYRIGETYSLGGTHTIVSYNGTDTVTLNSAPDTSIEYADRWLIFQPYASQSAGSYPRAIFGAIVQDDLTHGAGSVVGRPFLP